MKTPQASSLEVQHSNCHHYSFAITCKNRTKRIYILTGWQMSSQAPANDSPSLWCLSHSVLVPEVSENRHDSRTHRAITTQSVPHTSSGSLFKCQTACWHWVCTDENAQSQREKQTRKIKDHKCSVTSVTIRASP